LRQPALRGAVLNPSLNVLANPTLFIDTDGDGRPDSWAWSSTTNVSGEAINSGAETYRAIISTTGTRDFRQTTAAASAAPGDVWSFSFQIRRAPSTANNTGRAQAKIEFLDNANNVLATAVGTLTTYGVPWQMLSVTSLAAPASTDRVRCSISHQNSSAAADTVDTRYAQLEKSSSVSLYRVGTQTMVNDPASGVGRTVPIFIEGTAKTPAIVTIQQLDSGGKIAQYVLAHRGNEAVSGRRNLTDFLNSTSWVQCESGTLTNNTATAVDADGSPGSGNSVAQTSAGSNPTVMNRRVRMAVTTKLASRRGRFHVFARLKATAAAQHTVQLRWGPGASDPVPFSNDEYIHDVSGATSFEYVDVDLGIITIPEELAATLNQITLELWSRRDSGTGNLNWDFVALVPTAGLSTIQVPGGSREKWLGSDLQTPPFRHTGDPVWTAGAVKGSGMQLTDSADAAGTPPNSGLPWGVGRHLVTFTISSDSGGWTNIFQVVNVTDDTVAVSKVVNPPQGTSTVTVRFDGVAGKSYQAQVANNGPFTQDIPTTVKQIVHTFIPYLQQNEQARTDPGSVPKRFAAEKLDSSGNLLSILRCEGPLPLMLKPGLHILYLHQGDIPLDGYAEESKSIRTRQALVTVSYAPRWIV
ncbi:MAG: hypothetical protein ACJ76P_05355, partial [Actinomycetota bacterium]